MEMNFIYQSAAWILAAILLAVVIFLTVTILIIRRKDWVQMSCYSAPRKVRDAFVFGAFVIFWFLFVTHMNPQCHKSHKR